MELYYFSALLILPMFIYSMWASNKVKRTFAEFSSVSASSRISAAQAARKVLDEAGLQNVEIRSTSGNLTDHYDPRDNIIYLSDSVYGSSSVAAIGVATHEVGHAIQQNSNYLPIKVRAALVPIVNIGSRLSLPLILFSFIFEAIMIFNTNISLAYVMSIVGLVLYSLSTIFAFVTLPVEFNASSRAQKILKASGILTEEEATYSRKVLSAAAQTYVASFAMSLVYLLRMVAIVMMRGNRRK